MCITLATTYKAVAHRAKFQDGAAGIREVFMHIPDGYLSPSTCAVAYAVALPFWYTGLRRMRRKLNSRVVPLLSVISAFSFVVMMFNLPIPGGTTAHAVGMGLAAILLGPWAGLLAISIALAIQALFFGDGGVTSFGANSFNMGIVGAFVAYGVYRLISTGAAVTSPRRIVAAAIAGYAAINAAAFFAALQFGVQPLLFTDATGAPLYAPYPLSIAIPSMMVAHLTVAGLAEAIITAGVVAYLQRANPDLLKLTAGLSDMTAAAGWKGTRALWAGLGAMMVASPLGLVAAGVAWGEWGVEDFQSAEMRAQISNASANMAPPAQVPHGLDHLSSIWTAPMPDYAPAFMHDANFGYIVSAVIGAGLIVLVCTGLSWLFNRGRQDRIPT
jgi:cobalt/nickel transport system permease protein